jgi:hypothetical protein
MNYPGFEFKPRQVNNSSQSNQETDHLVSHPQGEPNASITAGSEVTDFLRQILSLSCSSDL